MRLSRPLLFAMCAAVATALAAGCATPVAPSGGPRDTTPPVLVTSAPAAGTTRVTEPTLTLQFSERLDAASAARAVTVTPQADDALPPRISVRGSQLTVELPPLREATTYVVTVGTELADARRVRLAAPVTVAFATGDAIDAGRIEGTVREPTAGRPAAGLAVWAYTSTAADSTADPRRRAPDYRTETGADGRFQLAYLRPGPYHVVAVADANRNGRADDGEAFAVPLRPVVRADTAAIAPPLVLFMARADTTAPAVRTVRALSDRRVAVRLSEPVVLDATRGGWTAEDSLSGATVALRPYQVAPSEIAVVAPGPLPAAMRLRLATPGAAADSAGNALAPFVRSLARTEARPDTATARLAAFVPAARADSVRTLGTGEWPGARFTVPPDTAAVRLRAADGTPLAVRRESRDGLTVRLVPQALVSDGAVLTLEVALPDSVAVRRYRVASADETGAIVGTVPGGGAGIVVEVRPEGSGAARTVPTDAAGRFAVARLPPGRYRLRLWADRDGDGRWSGGRLAPFTPPEPLTLLAEPVAVRARWDTEVEPDRLALPDAP